jgi:hypothetical protein
MPKVSRSHRSYRDQKRRRRNFNVSALLHAWPFNACDFPAAKELARDLPSNGDEAAPLPLDLSRWKCFAVVLFPGVRVPGVRVPGVRVPGVRVPGVRVPGYRSRTANLSPPAWSCLDSRLRRSSSSSSSSMTLRWCKMRSRSGQAKKSPITLSHRLITFW